MFIKDLQPRQTDVDVEGEVTEMSDVREFNKFGRQGKVANAMIKDGTGKVKLSLWNEQIEKVKVGDTVKLQKGYVGEFQGELQLTTGKFGTIEVTKKDEQPEGSVSAPAKETPSPAQGTPASQAPEKKKFQEIRSDEMEDEKPDSLDVEEEDFS
jgi:replication factor A1